MNEEDTAKYRRLIGIFVSGLFVLSFVGWMVWTSIHPSIANTSTRVFTDGDLAPLSDAASPKFASLTGTVVDPLTFASGVSGTYTVSRGYVVAVEAVASAITDAGGGVDAGDSGIVGATVTITPNGPSITGSAVTQPPILIPSGYAWSVTRPVIQGSASEMGVGTVIVFNGTVTYTVVMSLGGS